MNLNKIRSAEEEIEIETRLRTGKISLRDLGLRSLPESILELTHLVALDLRGNLLTSLPNNLLRLHQLKEIFLNNNNFTEFPLIVLELAEIEVLEMSGNNLIAVPDEIVNLHKLHHLNISNNENISISNELCNVGQLRTLVAAAIGAKEIPSVILSCQTLQTLNVSNNPIKEIPRQFINLVNLRSLIIDESKLERPPLEIVSRGPGAIINYLHAFDRSGEAFTLREAKLLIVGQGGVGKSFLMERLINDSVLDTDKTTEGIKINVWTAKLSDGNEIRINTWDFGGQEIYHSTHQFFLTKRSLYLFIWDSRREDNILHFDYWLNVIKLLSDSSPTLVVQNKIDERIKMIDETSIQDKFQNISEFHKVSAIRGTGIPDLRASILQLIPTLEHFGDTLPISWKKIREELESNDRPYLSHAEYQAICMKYGLDEGRADYLSQYFHDLGVFLHFQDNEVLKKIIFLKPEWATNAVYRLYDDKRVQNAFGLFTLKTLDGVWGDIADVRYQHLIELMKKFELCFQIPNREEHIIPELLSTARPNFWWNDEDNLHFHYVYDFMPSGILTRLIVRMQGHTRSGTFWKNGVVFNGENALALVVAHPLQRKITIQIDGADKGELLSKIRREIQIIHESMNKLGVREMLPCVCDECRDSETPYMHEFEYLKRAKARQKWTVECKQTLEEVRVDNILRDVRSSRKRVRPRILVDDTETLISDMDIATNVDETADVGKITVRRNYSRDLFALTSIDSASYSEILKRISLLSPDQNAELARLLDVLSKDWNSEKSVLDMRGFFARHNTPLMQNMSASALYELLKYLFISGG